MKGCRLHQAPFSAGSCAVSFTRQIDVPGYSRMFPVSEISDAKNDYNLNLPRYIDSTEAEAIQDRTDRRGPLMKM